MEHQSSTNYPRRPVYYWTVENSRELFETRLANVAFTSDPTWHNDETDSLVRVGKKLVEKAVVNNGAPFRERYLEQIRKEVLEAMERKELNRLAQNFAGQFMDPNYSGPIMSWRTMDFTTLTDNRMQQNQNQSIHIIRPHPIHAREFIRINLDQVFAPQVVITPNAEQDPTVSSSDINDNINFESAQDRDSPVQLSHPIALSKSDDEDERSNPAIDTENMKELKVNNSSEKLEAGKNTIEKIKVNVEDEEIKFEDFPIAVAGPKRQRPYVMTPSQSVPISKIVKSGLLLPTYRKKVVSIGDRKEVKSTPDLTSRGMISNPPEARWSRTLRDYTSSQGLGDAECDKRWRGLVVSDESVRAWTTRDRDTNANDSTRSESSMAQAGNWRVRGVSGMDSFDWIDDL